MRLIVLSLLLSVVSTAPLKAAEPAPSAQAAATPLVIGETFTIESKALGETRRINVYRPQPWGLDPKAPLPVLYMPDGGIGEDFLHVAGLVQVLSGNGSMRPFLLVGIENTERRRDMTGPSKDPQDQKIAPRIGGSAAYRSFLRDELMPQVRQRYPTTEERALIGESLAGLFVVETLLQEPALFNSYIALDPSLWWNRGAMLAGAAKQLPHGDACAAARIPGQQWAAGAGRIHCTTGRVAAAGFAVAAGEVPAVAGRNPRYDLSSGCIAGAAHAVPGAAVGLALIRRIGVQRHAMQGCGSGAIRCAARNGSVWMQRVRGWSVAACLAVSGCAMSMAPPATQPGAKEVAATVATGVVLPETEALRVHDPVGRDYPIWVAL